jgi:hypothetical protein
MDKGLIDVSQMFLVPASILFTALGAARTEQLKTLISVMGTLLSIIWVYSIYSLYFGVTGQQITVALAAIFLVASFISACVHAYWWREQGKSNRSGVSRPHQTARRSSM